MSTAKNAWHTGCGRGVGGVVVVSLSTIFTCPCPSATYARTGSVRVTANTSVLSLLVSPSTAIVIDLDVSPARNVSVPVAAV